ncbi:MAG: transporter [Halodesulfurarchaeum sp.]
MTGEEDRRSGKDVGETEFSDKSKIGRRTFLATGAALSTATVAGCLGSGGSNKTTQKQAPEKPWTTQELAEYIDSDATITIYAGTGDAQQWHDLIEVINDEYGTNLTGNVFASNGSAVSQRFIQERQAGEDKVDVLSTISDLRDRIKKIAANKSKEKAIEYARQWFEWDIDQNFWFTEVLPDKLVMPFLVSSRNGGAGLVLPISDEVWEAKGLDVPTTYNDLFQDQYKGLTVGMPNYVSPGMTGWITRYHAKRTDMSNMEWIKKLMSRFELVGYGSYSSTMRDLGKGNIAMMLYNWPWAAAPFIKNEKLAASGVFTDPVKRNATEGALYINKKAPNPWLARFFLSASLELAVQRRMLTDVRDAVPVRIDDIDLSQFDLHPYTKRRFNANLFRIGFWESAAYNQVGQNAIDTGVFKV